MKDITLRRMRKINKIIVHCTATPEGKDYHVKDVDKWHKAQGWKGIGYHYLVTLDGTIEKGRPENEVGAHCTGQNKDSIGICYVGGLAKDGKTAKDTRTEAQRRALLELIVALIIKYPQAKIYGHRDFASKACPCFDARKEYYNINLK